MAAEGSALAIWRGLFVQRLRIDMPVRSPEIRSSASNVFSKLPVKVSFPVQMLGKSFKMMPVMLWGIVISFHGIASVHSVTSWKASKVQTIQSQGHHLGN